MKIFLKNIAYPLVDRMMPYVNKINKQGQLIDVEADLGTRRPFLFSGRRDFLQGLD